MTEFRERTLDTMIERLRCAISGFDREWIKNCIPATEQQLQHLEDICCQNHYTLPEAYRKYLMAMGQNDGGLLERQWDGYCKPNIDYLLELLADEEYAKDDWENGLLLFSHHWTDANSYLRLSDWSDNPVVTDMDGKYFAGSFEKYLFQQAFKMYHEKFPYEAGIGNSVKSMDEVLRKYSRPCTVFGGTAEERMDFIRHLVEPFHPQKTWFSDNLHYFCYNEEYALSINLHWSCLIVFSCNDPVLKEKADRELTEIFTI